MENSIYYKSFYLIIINFQHIFKTWGLTVYTNDITDDKLGEHPHCTRCSNNMFLLC